MFLITNQNNHSLNFTISLENSVCVCVFVVYDIYLFVGVNLYAPMQSPEGNTEHILIKIGSDTESVFVLFLVRLTGQKAPKSLCLETNSALAMSLEAWIPMVQFYLCIRNMYSVPHACSAIAHTYYDISSDSGSTILYLITLRVVFILINSER